MSRLYTAGPYTIDLEERVVARGGDPVPLPPKVFDTLAALVARGGRIASKDELMAEVWPDAVVEEANLTQNIFTLRRALADGLSIETVPRRGYRLTTPVVPARAEEELVVERRESVRIVTHEEELPERRTALVLGALAVVVAVIASVATVLFARRPADRLERLQVRRLTTTGNVTDAAISPDGRFVVYVTESETGHAIRLRQVATTSNVEIVPASATRLGELTFTPDGEHVYYLRGERGATSLFAVSTLGGNPRKVLDDVRSPVAFAPDGRRFAFIRWFPDAGEQRLMIADADGSALRAVATRKRPAVMVYEGPSWSPDGESIAFVANDSFGGPSAALIEVRVNDGTERLIASGLGPSAGKVAWLPDRSGIAVASEQLWLYRYPGGERTRITNDALAYSSVSVSADGKRVVAVQTNRTSEVFVDGRSVAKGAGINNGVSWFADGERLAFLATQDGNTDVWTMRADGSDPRQLTTHPQLDNHPSVCGNDEIVFASARQGGSTIWRMDADGGNARRISGAGAHYGLECAPGGRWLVFHRAGEQSSWDVWRMNVDGTGARRLTTRPATFPAISPDGKWIACNYLADRWTIAVLPADGSSQPRLLDAPGVPTRRIRWAPDGNAVVYSDERELVRVPLDGSAPTRESGGARILAFDYSPGGARLAIVRGEKLSDAILLSNF